MKQKIILLVGYFSVVPLTLLFLILFSLSIVHEKNDSSKNLNLNLFQSNVQYSALPESPRQSEMKVEAEDARIIVLKEFFERYNSPLVIYAEKIVKEADLHSIDYRLLPAIAMKESNLCKKIPVNSFNCWGFGIYGDKVTRFDSYATAIETVSKGLSKNYIQKGLIEPFDIMQKYTPSSNGSWAQTVNHYMEQIDSSL